MRDVIVADVTFITPFGDSVIIKDKREIPQQQAAFTHTLMTGEMLDGIAVQHYGDKMESECYKIFDCNIEKIVDSGFDLRKIKTLGIPN